MRERKPSRNCPLRGQSSNGSRRIVRRGLLVPDAEEPALFSRGLTKIRLTTPSWQDISDGNSHEESSFNSRGARLRRWIARSRRQCPSVFANRAAVREFREESWRRANRTPMQVTWRGLFFVPRLWQLSASLPREFPQAL